MRKAQDEPAPAYTTVEVPEPVAPTTMPIPERVMPTTATPQEPEAAPAKPATAAAHEPAPPKASDLAKSRTAKDKPRGSRG